MVTVVDKEASFTSETSFDAIDALEELEIDDLDAIPEFIREDESNAHHLPAQPRQQGPKAPVAPAQPAPAPAAPAPVAAPVAQPVSQPAPVAQQAPLVQPSPVSQAAPAPVTRTGPAITQTMPALSQQPAAMQPMAAPTAPMYAPSSPTSSAPAPNPFTAPPAAAPMDSFQSISPMTSSSLPAYSPATTLPPQTTSHRHHGLGSPLLDRHPSAVDDSHPPDELETLWPGVSNHQELGGIIQAAALKKTPSFYVMIGFMAGAVVSLVSVWGYSSVTTHLAKGNSESGKEIVTKVQEAQKEQNLVVQSIDPNAEIVPISSTYEVKSGDTLVVIAMKNYKKVTPRLIDQIVKTNGLKSANALSLGQELKLPNYRNQSSKLAHRTAAAARERQVQ